VKRIAPWEDALDERRLQQRPGGTVAVRDVECPAHPGRTPLVAVLGE
jgi:hypothetical protein